MKAGSPWIKGLVQREGADLIFTVDKAVNKNLMARKVYKILTDYKARIPLRNILIMTPKDLAQEDALLEREEEANRREERRRRYIQAEKERMRAVEAEAEIDENQNADEVDLGDVEEGVVLPPTEDSDSEDSDSEDSESEDSDSEDSESEENSLIDELEGVQADITGLVAKQTEAIKSGDASQAEMLARDIETLKKEKLEIQFQQVLQDIPTSKKKEYKQTLEVVQELEIKIENSRGQFEKSTRITNAALESTNAARLALGRVKQSLSKTKKNQEGQKKSDDELRQAIFDDPDAVYDIFIEQHMASPGAQQLRRELQREDDETRQYQMIRDWLEGRQSERSEKMAQLQENARVSKERSIQNETRLQTLLLKKSRQNQKQTKRERRFAEARCANKATAMQLMRAQLNDELKQRTHLQETIASAPPGPDLPEIPQINIQQVESGWNIPEDSQQDLEEIHERFAKMESDIEALLEELEDNRANASQIFARIRASRSFLLQKVREFVREHPEYADDLMLIDRLDAAIDHAHAHMEEAQETLLIAKQEEVSALEHSIAHQTLQDITDDLLADRRRDAPSESLNLVDPIEDLRGPFLSIRDKVRDYLEHQPALRPMYCELIRRIWDLEAQELENLGLPPHRYGPAGELWDKIPQGYRIATFLSAFANWRMLEDRYWWRLGEANKRKT
jgi:hypothetical protein